MCVMQVIFRPENQIVLFDQLQCHGWRQPVDCVETLLPCLSFSPFPSTSLCRTCIKCDETRVFYNDFQTCELYGFAWWILHLIQYNNLRSLNLFRVMLTFRAPVFSFQSQSPQFWDKQVLFCISHLRMPVNTRWQISDNKWVFSILCLSVDWLNSLM